MRRVYIMDCGNCVKIGVSINPDKRKEQLHMSIKQYYCTQPIKNAFEIESRMHSFFSSKRTNTSQGREYFDVDFDYAVSVLRQQVKIPIGRKPDRLKMVLVGGDGLSESDRLIAEKLIKLIPNMSEFDKGYLLGKTETLADVAESSSEKKE